MVANPGPRHEKHIAFICHFHHSWANLVKQTATLHGCTCTLCLHPGTAPKEHTKINRAVALSHEALSGTSRSHCLTLPLRRRLVFFHTAVVPSILYLHPSFSARLRQDQFVPSCVHPMLLGRKKKSNVRNITNGACRKQLQRTYTTGSNARQTNWRNKPLPPTIAVACQATASSAFSSPPFFLPESASVSVFSLHNWTNGSYHPRTKMQRCGNIRRHPSSNSTSPVGRMTITAAIACDS